MSMSARSELLIRVIMTLVFLSCFGTIAWAQPGMYSSKDNKAIKEYEKALDCLRLRQWSCAESGLKKALKLDAEFVEPRFTLAELFAMQDKHADAMAAYREALAKSSRFFPNAYLHLADIEFRDGQYLAAEQHYARFIELNEDPVREQRAQLGMASCAFAQEAIKHPVPFEPANLGEGVNTRDAEYYPCITADDSTLMLTRRVNDGTPPYGMQEDFFISRRQLDGTWGTATLLTGISTPTNEGAGTLSPDGRFLIFTACELQDGTYGAQRTGLGSCDLFISRRIGITWSTPENLGPPVNSANWETQPSLASDGRTLFFIRGTQARDGIRSMDIFVTHMQEDGGFSKPEKLGPSVNTQWQEESVQIHPDGRTLYFSSNGHPGFGGLDIFVSRMQDDGSWGTPQNLGYPINTGNDENSLLVNARGDMAFFASDRKGGLGELDLYNFAMPDAMRPTPVSYVRGYVRDRVSGNAVEADVEILDPSTGKLITAAYSDPNSGEFLVCLPVGRDLALNASADGYLFFSANYQVAHGTLVKPFRLDVPLSPVKPGESITLRNIFFETASYALLPASNAELSKLVKFMQGTPTLRIELGGHTDHVGEDAANQMLSEQRANAVRDHLIKAGIDGTRVIAKGYGESLPVETNDTEEGRALNRRTEAKVL